MSVGPQIYYTRSLDNGTTWEAERNITPTAPLAGKNLAAVAVSDSIVHVTWMDFRFGPQIYYTRSLDNGTTWEIDRSITPVPSQFSSVAVSDSIVHVVYADFRFGPSVPKIFYIRSLNDGTNWETEIQLADDSASWYPSVAVSGSIVHVVWPDNRHGDTSEIYYKRSTDNGTTWETDIRLTDNPSESREPSVAVSGSYVHAVWHDSRDGNWEIYYKRNPTGNPIEAPLILNVTDIPDDQGRWVRITWLASFLDQAGSMNPITQYGIWRRIDEYDEGLSHQERNSLVIAGIEDSLEGWDAVGTVPAIQDSIYNFVSPTLVDSNASGINYSIFLITAHTQDPLVWFASEPDSGYSVDNIPPETPYNLVAEVIDSDVLLTWEIQLSYPDFSHFAVYRDTLSGFTPGDVNRIGISTVPTYTDTSVAPDTYYYVVSALDVNGNESDYSNEVEATVTGIREAETGLPTVYALYQNYPNPFKTETSIYYQLPQANAVTIAIYNVSGQRIKTLVNERKDAGFYTVRWDGKTQDDQRVSNGVYFCRMVAGAYISVKKILLTR
ncbi:MAG: T9SS type A sorting domain-containing protein [candidate division WOR-3 bacterium]|nr:MAG: T9SS type A sorting domain-containing protein [candidate division WOR-3 bacterium]